jgi:hypothetical protein
MRIVGFSETGCPNTPTRSALKFGLSAIGIPPLRNILILFLHHIILYPKTISRKRIVRGMPAG